MKKSFWIFFLFLGILIPILHAEESKTYYPDGKTQTEVNDSGMKTYYESGKLKSKAEYVDGQAATTVSYYESGKIMRKRDESGNWIEYDENGDVTGQGKE